MRPPPTSEATAGLSRGYVVRHERVEAGARTALIRVTIDLCGSHPAEAVAGARLVAGAPGRLHRCAALPAPPPGDAAVVTLGFAMPATATPLGVELGGRWLALPAPDAARAEFEQRLSDSEARLAERLSESEARLAESRGACARLELAREEACAGSARLALARDEALRALVRAEAAAHDASARADALGRGIPAEGSAESREPRLGSPRRASRVAVVAACALVPTALLVATLGWPARDGDSERGVAAASASAVQPRPAVVPVSDPLAARLHIPADYLALYRTAAARYGLDWIRLAAVGAIESGHGQAPVVGIASGANVRGASGPAQFLPGTWERFGVDGNGDGARDPHDPADAIPAMASYLRASGAPQDWRAALRSYNHSDAYVTAVEALAASLRRDAT